MERKDVKEIMTGTFDKKELVEKIANISAILIAGDLACSRSDRRYECHGVGAGGVDSEGAALDALGILCDSYKLVDGIWKGDNA